MKVIVGLGNPGQDYENTRHNVGFEVVDELKKKITNNQAPSTKQIQISNFKYQKKFDSEICQFGELMLVKPHTYMNDSGRAVRAVLDYYRFDSIPGSAAGATRSRDLSNLWVVHDDLDIVMGEYKIQLGKGPKIHGGVNSIGETLGKEEFWRVRIGVDSRSVEQRSQIEGRKYVLMKLGGEDKKLLEEVVDRVVEELQKRLVAGV